MQGYIFPHFYENWTQKLLLRLAIGLCKNHFIQYSNIPLNCLTQRMLLLRTILCKISLSYYTSSFYIQLHHVWVYLSFFYIYISFPIILSTIFLPHQSSCTTHDSIWHVILDESPPKKNFLFVSRHPRICFSSMNAQQHSMENDTQCEIETYNNNGNDCGILYDMAVFPIYFYYHQNHHTHQMVAPNSHTHRSIFMPHSSRAQILV
jgi:hypothetical protein